jgi:hypothetical protein
MTWTDWLREGRLEPHKAARGEIAALRRAAERSLRDSALPDLSPEGRFQLAYGAALDIATVAVLAAGYRVRARVGHHQLVLEAAAVALGPESDSLLSYLDLCRRRRNTISYEGDEVGDEQAQELLRETGRFAALVKAWLEHRHRDLL